MVRISHDPAKVVGAESPSIAARGRTKRKVVHSPTVDIRLKSNRISTPSVWMERDTSECFSTESPVTPHWYTLDRWTESQADTRLCTHHPVVVHKRSNTVSYFKVRHDTQHEQPQAIMLTSRPSAGSGRRTASCSLAREGPSA
jgi:hypothetical protein